MRYNRAFTIIEIVVVITVIAILSSLAILTFDKTRTESRDAARSSNITVISEALEKYYERNGEYPSVASIVNNQPANTGAAIASKLSIPVDSLVMPNTSSATTNAITALPNPAGDVIVYEGYSAENNSSCQSDVNGGCDQFILQYNNESTGETEVVESRRSARIEAIKPELELTLATPSVISASWSSIMGATSYELQYSTSASFSAPTTTTHTSTSASTTGLAPNTEFFFRVRGVQATSFSNWSDTQSMSSGGFPTPTGTITIAAAMSGANARGTTGGGSCASGSLERQIRYQVNGGAWQAWAGVTTTRDVPATEGYTYTFQAQARCAQGGSSGAWVHSASASVTAPVVAPSGLTISAAMSGANAVGTAGGGSCASGTTIERQIRHQVNGGAWTAYTTGTPRSIAAAIGSQYTFQQQARCVGSNGSSGWAASSTASITRPIPTPPVPGLTVATSGATSTWTATSSCSAGTTATYQRQSLQQGGTWTAWEGTTTANTSTWNTSAQGYTYSRKYRVQCTNAYGSSAWSGESATISYTRPIDVPAATGWTHVSLGWQNEANCKYYNGCKWRRFNWTAPTCPAGTTYYSSRWNSYVGTKMSWDNGQSSIYRWWYGLSQTGTTSDSVAYTSAQTSHIVEYSSNVPANYDDVKHKLIWTCRNNTTGVTGTTEIYSPVFRYM